MLSYSSSVVAPIHCTSPLARAGLNIFEASNEPVAPPAPTNVISSINKIISGFASNSVIISSFFLQTVLYILYQQQEQLSLT